MTFDIGLFTIFSENFGGCDRNRHPASSGSGHRQYGRSLSESSTSSMGSSGGFGGLVSRLLLFFQIGLVRFRLNDVLGVHLCHFRQRLVVKRY